MKTLASLVAIVASLAGHELHQVLAGLLSHLAHHQTRLESIERRLLDQAQGEVAQGDQAQRDQAQGDQAQGDQGQRTGEKAA